MVELMEEETEEEQVAKVVKEVELAEGMVSMRKVFCDLANSGM